MASWYVNVKTGPHPAPARGSHRSLEAACDAVRRFYARYGAEAGHYIEAGTVRTLGPLPSRSVARDARIGDNHPIARAWS